MTCDPIRKCWQCQLPKQRESFRALPGKVKREVCSTCYDITMAARERIKREGNKPDTVVF